MLDTPASLKMQSQGSAFEIFPGLCATNWWSHKIFTELDLMESIKSTVFDLTTRQSIRENLQTAKALTCVCRRRSIRCGIWLRVVYIQNQSHATHFLFHVRGWYAVMIKHEFPGPRQHVFTFWFFRSNLFNVIKITNQMAVI